MVPRGLSAGARGLGAASVVMLCRLTYRRPDELACRTQEDDSSVTAYDPHRARLRWPELDSWPATARSRRRTFRAARRRRRRQRPRQSGRSDEQHTDKNDKGIDRRDFFRAAGAGLTAAGLVLSPAEQALADNSRPTKIGSPASRRAVGRFGSIFKSRPPGAGGGGRGGAGRGNAAPGAGGAAAAPGAGAGAAPQGAGAGAAAGRGNEPAVVQRSPPNAGVVDRSR